jgi:hypothetical protein
MKRVIVGFATTVLVSGGLGLAGLGLAAAAQADPAVCNDLMCGPNRWCPGSASGPVNLNWDVHVCHTYYYVPVGNGNVAPNIWEGNNPPTTPPPPPPKPDCPPWATIFSGPAECGGL